jgi:hypothetical protein
VTHNWLSDGRGYAGTVEMEELERGKEEGGGWIRLR